MRKTDSPRWGDPGRRRQSWHLSPGRSHSRAWVQIPSPWGFCTLLLNLGKNLHPTWVSPLVSFFFSFLAQLLFCHPTIKNSFSTLNHIVFYQTTYRHQCALTLCKVATIENTENLRQCLSYAPQNAVGRWRDIHTEGMVTSCQVRTKGTEGG